MPKTPSPRQFVPMLIAGACALLATAPAAMAQAVLSDEPRVFQLAGQTTAGATIWAEDCTQHVRSATAQRPAPSRVAWRDPQPDPGVVARLMSALRRGDLAPTGVRVVETRGGPMLMLAGTRPDDPPTYFTLCNVAIRTSYE